MKIDAINISRSLEQPSAKEKSGSSFVDMLKDSISKVSEVEKEADKEVQKLATMETQDIHNAMISMEKADLTFQLMMQIRNKIIDAYQEIMRMQV